MSVPTASKLVTAKRLKNELKEMRKEKLEFAQAIQDETNQFVFFFLIKGADDSVYKGGYYIGKIVFPEDYPNNPGAFYMLTPSGRFMVEQKICLTNSDYHKESWTPTWDVVKMMIGFYSIFHADTDHGISHIFESTNSRLRHAENSISFNMHNHKNIFTRFDQFINEDGTIKPPKEKEPIKESSREKPIVEKPVESDKPAIKPIEVVPIEKPVEKTIEKQVEQVEHVEEKILVKKTSKSKSAPGKSVEKPVEKQVEHVEHVEEKMPVPVEKKVKKIVKNSSNKLDKSDKLGKSGRSEKQINPVGLVEPESFEKLQKMTFTAGNIAKRKELKKCLDKIAKLTFETNDPNLFLKGVELLQSIIYGDI